MADHIRVLTEAIAQLPARYRRKIIFHFNIGDGFIGTKSVNPARRARCAMPANLAGLLWLHNQPPFGATARPNPTGYSCMPAGLDGVAETTDSA